MKDSDGKSPTTLPELTMEITPSLESGSEESATPRPSRKQLRDFRCRTFAFIGGEEPHFIFSGEHGEWGRLYVTDTQIALSVECGSSYIGDLVRASKRT